MKKTTKFLSFLLFAPLLTGCGNGVKAPKFAKYGDEVKFEKFYENLNAAFKKATFLSETKTLGSVQMKGEYAELEGGKITRGKKTYSETSALTQTRYENKVDVDHSVYEMKVDYVEASSSKDASGETSNESETVMTMTYQVATISKQKWLVGAVHETKEYGKEELLEGVKEQTFFDNVGKGATLLGLQECISSIEMQYDGETEEGKKDYKFYQNGNVYTVEMNWQEEQENKEDDVVYSKEKSTCKWIVQLDMTEGKWSGKEYLDSKTVTEYKKAYGQYVEGDVLEETGIIKQEFSAQTKKLNLKPQDLSKYKYIGE
jgi:hypothetical protein